MNLDQIESIMDNETGITDIQDIFCTRRTLANKNSTHKVSTVLSGCC